MKIYHVIVQNHESGLAGFISASVLAASIEDLQQKLNKHLNKYQVLELIHKKVVYQLRADGSTHTSVRLGELEN